MIIEELINQLQHVYNDSELKKRVTCILKALKQNKKSFARHLITFKQTLLKAEDLKWDDAVKKTFLNNSLDITFMWALIVISIFVLYDEYIILLQWVSHNLNSIQKAVTQECHMTTIIIMQQSHTDNINWKLTEHVIVAVTETEERHRAQWVSEKKVTKHHIKQLCMHCKDNDHFIKNCKLLSAVWSYVINVVTAETVKKTTEEEKNSEKKVAFNRSHSWECIRCDKSWKKFKKQMNSVLFTMSTLINKKSYAHTLYNTECLFYEMITSCFARNHNLQCMKIRPHMITEFDEPSGSSVNEVAVVQIDIDRHQKSRAFFYIVFKLAFYNLILDLSWMKQNKIIFNADRVSLTIEFTETIIQNRKASVESEFNHVMMSAMFFTNLIQKKKEKQKKIEVFSVSMADIEKALISQKKTDLRTILLDHYHEFLNVFNHTMTEKLLSLRKEDTDHQIKLKEVNEKKSKVLWGSLYNITKKELLVLCKTLTELLNKQFI